MPLGASSSVPVITLEVVLIASPSFAANLNCNHDEEIGDTRPFSELAIAMAGTPVMDGAPDGMEDVLQDDDGDDVEFATIADDSDDDIAMSIPAGGGGASSSGTQQYLPHFSIFDLDAMTQQGVPGVPVRFGAKDTQNTRALAKLQDKEEVVLSVNTYSIRCGVKYKVLKSNHRKYYGKCEKFGNGCIWLIQIILCQRRGKWYNKLHTSQVLDYHKISAFILPMIRADAAVSIKVLQNTAITPISSTTSNPPL
ncbi:hypothetical protein Ahy_A07g032334 [Arachis hypogaea]|uniref:Uncharacterized protein n=1 Tax=Arachis hypogaea TaxID=3818 RepID=A0A445C6N9_ARAHY|nr:hypothetical protein Ahy_A07g032334 [Arachis hypogaea]